MSAALKDLNEKGRETVVEMALQSFLHRLCLEQIHPLMRMEQQLFWGISGFRQGLSRVTAKGGTEFMDAAQRKLDARHEEFRQAVAFLQNFAAYGASRVMGLLRWLERTRTDMKEAVQGFEEGLDTKEGIWADSDVKRCSKALTKTREAVNDLERLLPALGLEDLYRAKELLTEGETKIWFAEDHPGLSKSHPMDLLLEKKALLIKALPEEYLRLAETQARTVPAISWDFSKTDAVIHTYADIMGQKDKDVKALLSTKKPSKLFDVIFSLFSMLKDEEGVKRREGQNIIVYPSYDTDSLIRPGVPLEPGTVWGLCANLEVTYEAPSFVSFTVTAQPSLSFLTWLGVAPHNKGAFSAFHNPVS